MYGSNEFLNKEIFLSELIFSEAETLPDRVE